MIANTKNLSVLYDKLLRKINTSQQQEESSSNTIKYPCIIPQHNSGVLSGIHPNPPGFYPHSFDSTTSNSRRQYYHTQEQLSNSNSILQTKYIAPEAYSLRVATIRSNSIGQSSYKEGLPDSSSLSFKGNYTTQMDERRSRRRARSSGCVAPAKKNGINNKAFMYSGV